MPEWVVKYWVEILFGLIVSGMGFIFKSIKKAIAKAYDEQKDALINTIDTKLNDQKTELTKAIEQNHQDTLKLLDERFELLKNKDENLDKSVSGLTLGLLSIQGRAFKEECRRLLASGYKIGYDDYVHILEEHKIYNSLGGNHDGDRLFNLVETKYSNYSQQNQEEQQSSEQ